jgi:curved DNA-binding protein CbpA
MRTPDFDAYAVLGVAHTATPDQIKAAYRELVAKYHPDHHQGNPLEELAASKLAEINRAYEILSDPEQRAAYDAGQPSWPRPVGSPFDSMSFGGRRRRLRWPYVIGIIMLLPLVLRLGVFLVRALARLFRVGAEGLGAARGTPLLLGVVVAVLAVAAFVLIRRRRR